MSASLSKYILIKEALLTGIASGEYPPMSKIPSENQLAETYGFSVPTIRKALSDLVYQGKIMRIKGKGTFVCGAHEGLAQQANQAHKNRLKIVSLIIIGDEDSDSSTMKIIRGAQSALSKQGYSITIECSHDSLSDEAQIIEGCIENAVDGVLLFSADPNANAKVISRLTDYGIPYVLLDRGMKSPPCSLVTSYGMDGMYKLASHLIEGGHRRIAYSWDAIELSTVSERFEGYRAALDKHAIPFDPRLLIDNVFINLRKLDEVIDTLAPTAIMCTNDKSAILVIEHLQKRGIDVPGSISVTGFDDNEQGQHMTPALTSVRQRFKEMGEQSANQLVSLIEGADEHAQIYLPVEVILRNSSRQLVSHHASEQATGA